jgi:hypothetical protein
LRRRLAQLRAEFHSAPWSIDIRALGMLDQALTAGDVEGVKATLAIGQDSCDSIVRMVGNVAVDSGHGRVVRRDELDGPLWLRVELPADRA